jgi:hypothetical protein
VRGAGGSGIKNGLGRWTSRYAPVGANSVADLFKSYRKVLEICKKV